MKNISIIGSGTMGVGIAQVALMANCKVWLYDIDTDKLKPIPESLKKSFNTLVEKHKITPEKAEEMLTNFTITHQLADLQNSDLVIEAIVENKEVKQKLFMDLEKIVSPQCVLSSNTSSIAITSLASALQYPERFIGIHFFNPAHILPLVEIIPSLLTENALPEKILTLMRLWKKEPIIVKDIPGFLVNRLARPYYGEGLRIAEENIATIQQIDTAMRHYGFKMGPFELMDLIGIDVNFAVTEVVYKDYFFDTKYKPSIMQKRMVDAKLWGRKTKKGFYDYSNPLIKSIDVEMDSALKEQIFMRIISMLVNEAVEALRLKIATADDIEIAMQKGVNYPKGLLAWGKEIGYHKISNTLTDLMNMYQEDRYRQSPLLRNL